MRRECRIIQKVLAGIMYMPWLVTKSETSRHSESDLIFVLQ